MEKVRKGDQIIMIAGKDKKKKGEVIKVTDKDKSVIVKGINTVKKSVKKSKEHPSGGYVELEAPVAVSNVMVFCPKCAKGTRVGIKVEKDSKKIRVCKKCGHKFE
jgi:large subunit ribosomal protein L24